jgi:hypothetical protein
VSLCLVRNFQCPRFIPCPRRFGFPDRRWQLRYGRESISEAYYSARLFPGLFTSIDLQHIANPAYNRDRGPVWVASLRLHLQFGKDVFSH